MIFLSTRIFAKLPRVHYRKPKKLPKTLIAPSPPELYLLGPLLLVRPPLPPKSLTPMHFMRKISNGHVMFCNPQRRKLQRCSLRSRMPRRKRLLVLHGIKPRKWLLLLCREPKDFSIHLSSNYFFVGMSTKTKKQGKVS